MEAPKTLWLKKHMDAGKFKQCMFFDLPDYLTYRATGSLARSNCSLACKYSYVPPGTTMEHASDGTTEVSEYGWSKRFFDKIGKLPEPEEAEGVARGTDARLGGHYGA